MAKRGWRRIERDRLHLMLEGLRRLVVAAKVQAPITATAANNDHDNLGKLLGPLDAAEDILNEEIEKLNQQK